MRSNNILVGDLQLCRRNIHALL